MNMKLPPMVRVSTKKPCPACKKADWCLVAADGKACICKRIESNRLLKNDAGWLHRFDDEGPRVYLPVEKPKPIKHESGINWHDEAIRYAVNLQNDRKRSLAVDLGLPENGLDPIMFMGYREDRSDYCFTFPERDGHGKIIGINRRYFDKSKKLLAGGSRGLSMLKGWNVPSELPLFIVEGPTDAAALIAAGIPAIGRPSNTGGVAHLVVALAEIHEDRTVCVLGENDLRMNWALSKPQWPGLEGAISTVRQLAEQLPHRFVWAIPPDDAKDARDWLTKKSHGSTAWKFRGWDFYSSIKDSFYGPDIGLPEFSDISRMNRDAFNFESESWNAVDSFDELLAKFVSYKPSEQDDMSALFR